MSGPIRSLNAKWPQSVVNFSISPCCPLILHVILPHTTHSFRINSSYLDQMVYTFWPQLPPIEFRLARKVEGWEKEVAPGNSPSVLLQQLKAILGMHCIRPRLVPAEPMKVCTRPAKDAPTSQLPATWSSPVPPLIAFLAMATPVEWEITCTLSAPVQASTASMNFLVPITADLEWQTDCNWLLFAGPHVVTYIYDFWQPCSEKY